MPNEIATAQITEMPPPPYHIAITLPAQTNREANVTIIQDSPPPSYEKVIT